MGRVIGVIRYDLDLSKWKPTSEEDEEQDVWDDLVEPVVRHVLSSTPKEGTWMYPSYSDYTQYSAKVPRTFERWFLVEYDTDNHPPIPQTFTKKNVTVTFAELVELGPSTRRPQPVPAPAPAPAPAPGSSSSSSSSSPPAMLAGLPEVFLIEGHGSEGSLDETTGKPMIMEEGITLVTYAECGVSMTQKTNDYLYPVFSDPEKVALLADPVKNKAEIERLFQLTIHIYTPGMQRPDLYYDPYLNWRRPNDVMAIGKGGVYKAPVPKDVFVLRPEISDLRKYEIEVKAPISPSDITRLYKGSVYPTEAAMQDVFRRNGYDPYGLRLAEPIGNVFKAIPNRPSVFYFVGCRAVIDAEDPRYRFAITRDPSDDYRTIIRLLEKDETYAIRRVGNRRDALPLLQKHSEELDAIVAKATKLKTELDKTIAVIQRKRAASTERQRRFANGGRRRTYRHKRNRRL